MKGNFGVGNEYPQQDKNNADNNHELAHMTPY
jgi:hypothetical protein